MPKKLTVAADYAQVRTVGIPRALLYWRYGTFWETFFQALGCEVVLSEPTDRAIVARGEALSIDECCLASKVYMGHVENLRGRCDAVFVPAYANLGSCRSFCTKFQALPDLVDNTFHHELPLVTCFIEVKIAERGVAEAFEVLAQRFGANAKLARRAVKAAQAAQDAADSAAMLAQDMALAGAKSSAEPQPHQTNAPRILVVAHPYITHDPYLGAPVLDALRENGAQVFLAESYDREAAYKGSESFSKTMPWQVNRELVGALLQLRNQVDGAVLVSAFPCGPDSMTNDAIMRCVTGLPILNLTIDAQSGTAGLETRVESFVDILKFQGKGGYV